MNWMKTGTDDLDDIYQELMDLEQQLESHMEETYASESFGLEITQDHLIMAWAKHSRWFR